ncbi:MAG: PA14 domain-containing protein [Luteolibacter sp.]
MNPDPHSHAPLPTAPKQPFWQKLGAGSLSISLMIHAVLLAVGVIWVIQVVTPVEKVVDFTPASGGGGAPASDVKAQKQRSQMVQPNLSRVVAIDAISNVSLPEPEEFTQMASLGGLSAGGLSSDLGMGGGQGSTFGKGFGSGLLPGMTDGRGTGNLFGLQEANSNGLAGTLYDLKQTDDLKPTGMTVDEMRETLKDIAKRGFKPRDFAKFYKAPTTLYQTKFLIPSMPADEAPAAFSVEQYVQPKQWFVVYRGTVQAPKSGRYRFVGAGDDVLTVRLNNRLVFDYGYTMAATGSGVNAISPESYEKDKNSDAIRNFKRLSPMPVPSVTYPYASTGKVNQALGGLAVGPEFEVKAGVNYPIEILISEIPGGVFSTALLIQEEGVAYQKDAAGLPILPLFRLDHSLPDPATEGEAPPFDPAGPVWKFVPGGAKEDI